ncbi:MAG: hypothetical protein ACI4RA_06700 [Kiritimatiellia bacterium]
MAADYLVSSLQPLSLDGPAPYTRDRFLEMCREQLGPEPFKAHEARWADLEGQLRNAIAAERARACGQDPAKWRHPVEGCSVYWANRVAAAFQEKDPAKRDRLLDQVRWDAAGELIPPASPLSGAAAYAYAIRLEIVLRRNALSAEAGNATFDRLTASTKIDLGPQKN